MIECHSLDLRAYIQSYEGNTRLERLAYIGEHCSNLQQEAYELLRSEVKKGINIGFYRKMMKLPWFKGETLDINWLENTERSSLTRLQRLEADLMAAKSSLAKESIRLGYLDIGDFHFRRGHFTESFTAYMQSADYISLPRQNVELFLNMFICCVGFGNHRQAHQFFNFSIATDCDTISAAKVHAAQGLTQLFEKNYRSAAKRFLEVGPEIGGEFSLVISPEDIATYTVLCGLSSFDRAEIRRSLLENQKFRGLLDLVPDFRILLQHYLSSRYGHCLHMLEEQRSRFLLDIYLHEHVENLFVMIRNKLVSEYFQPYSCVDLTAMSESFHLPYNQLEDILVQLIGKGALSAKIDAVNRILYRKTVNPSLQLLHGCHPHELSLQAAQDLQSLMLRLSVAQNSLLLTNADEPLPVVCLSTQLKNTMQTGEGRMDVVGESWTSSAPAQASSEANMEITEEK